MGAPKRLEPVVAGDMQMGLGGFEVQGLRFRETWVRDVRSTVCMASVRMCSLLGFIRRVMSARLVDKPGLMSASSRRPNLHSRKLKQLKPSHQLPPLPFPSSRRFAQGKLCPAGNQALADLPSRCNQGTASVYRFHPPGLQARASQGDSRGSTSAQLHLPTGCTMCRSADEPQAQNQTVCAR